MMGTEENAPCVRADGHILLLMESSPGHRTFSDYRNINMCLNNIVLMYEEYRDAFNEGLGGDLNDFQKWIDNFHGISLFEFDKEIGRYKRFPRESLKKMFERNDDAHDSTAQNGTSRLIDNATSRLNGFSLNGNNYQDDDDDSDDEENWDD